MPGQARSKGELPLAVDLERRVVFPSERDTIFAPASGARPAAIAVLRISGPDVRPRFATLAPGASFPAGAPFFAPCGVPAPGSRSTGR